MQAVLQGARTVRAPGVTGDHEAFRFSRLDLQRAHAGGELAQHVVEPLHVLFDPPQPRLGLYRVVDQHPYFRYWPWGEAAVYSLVDRSLEEPAR